jgi:hypothetical protein
MVVFNIFNSFRTYDPVAKLKIMCDSGYMQSCGEYKMSNRL